MGRPADVTVRVLGRDAKAYRIRHHMPVSELKSMIQCDGCIVHTPIGIGNASWDTRPLPDDFLLIDGDVLIMAPPIKSGVE